MAFTTSPRSRRSHAACAPGRGLRQRWLASGEDLCSVAEAPLSAAISLAPAAALPGLQGQRSSRCDTADTGTRMAARLAKSTRPAAKAWTSVDWVEVRTTPSGRGRTGRAWPRPRQRRWCRCSCPTHARRERRSASSRRRSRVPRPAHAARRERMSPFMPLRRSEATSSAAHREASRAEGSRERITEVQGEIGADLARGLQA